MVVSEVSPTVPTHWIVIVVVGSRCQVRKSVAGWNAASSNALGISSASGLSAPSMGAEANPANEAPKNARRDGENNIVNSSENTHAF